MSNGAAGSIAQEVLSSIRTVIAFDGQKKKKIHVTRNIIGIISQKKNVFWY
jgi:hypothetical protein